jgi:hypothetical protein
VRERKREREKERERERERERREGKKGHSEGGEMRGYTIGEEAKQEWVDLVEGGGPAHVHHDDRCPG